MSIEKLDINPLRNAFTSLQKALDEYNKDNTNEFVRDSCIYRFKLCYASAVFTLRKALNTELYNQGAFFNDSFQYLVSFGSQQKLIQSQSKWYGFRNDRAFSQYAYNETIAIQIVEQLPLFTKEISFLLGRLTKNS